MKAIEFQLDASKIIQFRFGESSLKPIDEFWTDFKPQGGEKTTAFIPNIIKDTPKNRELVEQIRDGYEALKAYSDKWDKQMYSLRNQFDK